jgi:ketosteroid isomerase-like protein
LDLDSYGPVPAQDYDYVVCSNCGSEFQPHIMKCVDCGAPTVLPGAVQDREREPQEVLAELAPPPGGSLGVVKSLYEALAAQDEVRIMDLLHPEVEWIQNEGFPGGGRRLGAKTVLSEVFGRLARDWEGWGADVQEWLDVPAQGTVIALGAYRGTCRRTGRPMRAVFAHVYRVMDGRIYRFEQYTDTAKIAEACAGG